MTSPHAKTEGRLSRLRRAVAGRPHLIAGVGVGIGAWLALAFAPELRWSTRSTLAWDMGCLTFILGVMAQMSGKGAEEIRANAARQDEGRGLILGLVLIASAASLASVAAGLGLAKNDHGLAKGLDVALATLTVTASWFMVQLIFALHYAHGYYGRTHTGGLKFPGEGDPDYWDFIHFAVVIGAAAQTADIAFTSKSLRRLGTLHSLIAFTFNTVVLALSINLLASLV
ncbi:MAG TPA: DUF1345 domain-containing protein [Phenylobacterium sp.]|nr:DUF1345 domain-containing protein [Phenylobacterium sp.]